MIKMKKFTNQNIISKLWLTFWFLPTLLMTATFILMDKDFCLNAMLKENPGNMYLFAEKNKLCNLRQYE